MKMSHRSGTNGTPSQSDTVKDPLCFPNVSNGNDKDNKGDVPLINFEEDGGSNNWPWDHIFKPNERGRTEVVCSEDMVISEFDPLASSGSETESQPLKSAPRHQRSLTPDNRHSNLLTPDSSTDDEENPDGFSNQRRHYQSDQDLLVNNNSDGSDDSEVCVLSPRQRSGGISSNAVINKEHFLVASDCHELLNSSERDWKYSTNNSVTTRESPLVAHRLKPEASTSSSSLSSGPGHKTRIKRSPHQIKKKKSNSPRLKIKFPQKSSSKPKETEELHPQEVMATAHQVFTGDPRYLRTQHKVVTLQMARNRDRFCDRKPHRIYIGSWNVNGKGVEEKLTHFVGYEISKRNFRETSPNNFALPKPAIFAFGFQELDLSAEVLFGKDSERETEWSTALQHSLERVGKYKLVRSIRLVGIFLLVYVEHTLADYVSEVESGSVRTGIMGMLGNKGGVAVRMKCHETTLCFVNSHLAAHMDEVEKRNDDFRQISTRMLMGSHEIHNHDVVFWLGDLNYRIQTSEHFNSEMVKKLSDNFQLQKLLEFDQLTIQKRENKVFEDYTEGKIDFKPTYKYDTGTDRWDTSEKARPPAWCDRILWKGDRTTLVTYRSHMEQRTSDHKPVSALFDVELSVVDPVKRTQVLEDVFRQVDKEENAYLPQVDLETQDVNIGDLKYNQILVKEVHIANTGRGVVNFCFQKKSPDDNDLCHPWLTVRPIEGSIWPGNFEKLVFIAQVNIDIAPEIAKGVDKLEDILVLHLENGKDYFITVHGNYQLSTFGASLGVLRYMASRGGVRSVPQQEIAELYKHPERLSSGSGSPYEIWQLTSRLLSDGFNEEGLFITQGKDSEIEQIREFLDEGDNYNMPNKAMPGSIHSVAQALLLFLESLAEPIIPHNLQAKCIEASNNAVLCRQVLHELPEIHRNSFVSIIVFLKEILQNSDTNKSEPKIVASVFANVLLRPLSNEIPSRLTSKKIVVGMNKKRATFIYQFLVHENLI